MEHYRDLIRPHGHHRSAAVFQAKLNACYKQTGASRFRDDTPAFKKCMLSRGFKWQYASADRPSRAAAARNAARPGDSGLSDLFGRVGTCISDCDRQNNDSPPTSPPDVVVAPVDNSANAAAQDMVNAGIAATIQTGVQFNTIYNPGPLPY